MALKIKRNLAELRDADVAYISLVDRAATRMPFRVVKRQEDEMIDLTAIGKGKIVKGERIEQPAITAVVVRQRKGDAANAKIAEVLKAAGFNVEKATKNDDKTITYLQVDEMPKDVKLVRLSDQVVVAVKGFQPCSDMGEADFAASANASGFYQGIDSALDVLFSRICGEMGDTDDPGEAAASVDALIDGFKAYVNNLISNLPTEAFKADISVRKTLAKAEEWREAARKELIAKRAAVKKGGMSVDGESDKDADDPDGVNLLKLETPVPEGFTGSPDDWSGMEDGEGLSWLLDSTNNRGHQDPSQAKKGDDMTIQSLIAQLNTKPEGFTDTDGDWATMSTGAKLDWLSASYNKANSQGAQASSGTTAKVDAADCAACADMKAAGKSEDEMKEAHKGHKAAKAESDTVDPDKKDQEENEKGNRQSQKAEEMLSQVLSGVASLTNSVAELQKKQEAIEKKVDTAVQKSENVEKKMATTVVAIPNPEDAPAARKNEPAARKNDSDPRSGPFDTGMMRRTKRDVQTFRR